MYNHSIAAKVAVHDRACGFGRLLIPADEYQLDRLLTPDMHPRTGKPRVGFETVAQCHAEDHSRAIPLRATAYLVPALRNGMIQESPAADHGGPALDARVANISVYRPQVVRGRSSCR
jgi:hypothetical protein